MHATIFHNPRCSTSRNALALIRHAGIEPTVVDDALDPLTRDRLVELISRAGLQVHDAIRSKDAAYASLGFDGALPSDEHLLDAMLANPC